MIGNLKAFQSSEFFFSQAHTKKKEQRHRYMAKAGMHIKSRSATSALLHNARVYKLSYAIASTEKNYTEYTMKVRDIQQMINTIKTDYKKHSYRGRRLPSNSTPIKEGVLNLNGEHTNEEVMKVAKKIAKKLGIKLMGVSIHRDEGYIDKQGKKHFNYHAHLLFNYYDFQKHKIVHQTNEQMKQMQTLVAEELHMERGVPKSETKRKHIEHGQYRAVAKEKAEAVEKALEMPKLTISSMKKEIATLRKEMKEKNAELEEKNEQKVYTAEDYQALAKLKKELKKDTVQEVYLAYLALQKELAKKETLQKENDKLKEELAEKPKEKIVRVPVEKIVENPLNRALQKELSEKKEELKEKEELLSVATETQDKFRTYAINYQKQLIEAQETIEEQETSISTLQAENSSLRAIVSGLTTYLKCTKDQIVEKVKNLFQKEEEPKEKKVYKKPPLKKGEIDIAVENTDESIILNPESKWFKHIAAEDDNSTPLDHQEIIKNSTQDPLVEKTKEDIEEDKAWEEVVRKNLGNKNPSMF